MILIKSLLEFSFCFYLFVLVSDCSLAKRHLLKLTVANIQISFSNNGTHTSFNLKSSQDGSVSNSWLAVGFNGSPKMVSGLKNYNNKVKIKYLIFSCQFLRVHFN